MTNKAFITPEILLWARKTCKMPIDIAAKKVGVSSEKLKYWEEGKLFPTVRQAKILAKVYKRPFAIFFLPETPNDFQPLNDFRSKFSEPLSSASIFIIREIQERQAWLSSLLEESGERALDFIGKYTQDDSPEKVANDILITLNINPLGYNTKNILLEWVRKVEDAGIFVSRGSNVNSYLPIRPDEIQGFAIADLYAPFVFINSSDWKAAQLFTLVHELAHLWINATGISNNIVKGGPMEKWHPVEQFCNSVAAFALIPTSIFKESDFDNITEVQNVSRKLGVSSFAFLIRMKRLNLLDDDKFTFLFKQAEKQYEEYLRKKKEKEEQLKLLRKTKKRISGPNQLQLQVNRNSIQFTRTVLDAYNMGVIQPSLASNLLAVKLNNFAKLEPFI